MAGSLEVGAIGFGHVLQQRRQIDRSQRSTFSQPLDLSYAEQRREDLQQVVGLPPGGIDRAWVTGRGAIELVAQAGERRA